MAYTVFVRTDLFIYKSHALQKSLWLQVDVKKHFSLSLIKKHTFAVAQSHENIKISLCFHVTSTVRQTQSFLCSGTKNLFEFFSSNSE